MRKIKNKLCNACGAAEKKYFPNIDQYKAYCGPCENLRYKEYLANNPEKKDTYRKQKQDHYNKLRESKASRPRPNTCEVCGRAGAIRFDHCHTTGKFRGWLCNKCNVTLGQVSDSAEILKKLIDYLEQHK